ncbi:MAG: matrixin family metalloprotease, partial [Candidatus Solibacter sp.]|nr:matrixin family metalloprotease [Candidatus Solibacter sp.]
MKLPNAVSLAAFLLVSCAWAQPVVRLKAGVAGARPLRTLPREGRGTHFLLQFPTEPGPELRRELERRGMRVLQYVPDAALMVASPVAPDLEGLGVLSAGELESSEKISPLLADQVTGALLVVFHTDVDMATARDAVRARGFDVLENAGLLTGHLVVSGPHSGIGALAECDDVAYIMPASAELAAGVPLVGCAGAATESGPVGEYVLVSRGWPKDSGGNVALHYSIRSLTDKLDQATARSEIERALREWTRYANFTLAPGSQQGADRTFDILFARGSHGDGYPFDGVSGTLAHTFYPAPPNPEPIAGDVHMDADEPWRTGANVDLYSVALHEVGHALGLGHADRPGSVMYPYYKLATGLTGDDIAGIRALYGSNVPPSTPPTPTPTPAPAPTPTPAPAPTPAPPATPG